MIRRIREKKEVPIASRTALRISAGSALPKRTYKHTNKN